MLSAPMIGAGAGTGVGATLGQALSLPRRLLWDNVLAPMFPAFEGADSGADVIRNLGGDDGMLSDIGGIGLEMATDPLTYGGGIVGRLLGSRPQSLTRAAEFVGRPFAKLSPSFRAEQAVAREAIRENALRDALSYHAAKPSTLTPLPEFASPMADTIKLMPETLKIAPAIAEKPYSFLDHADEILAGVPNRPTTARQLFANLGSDQGTIEQLVQNAVAARQYPKEAYDLLQGMVRKDQLSPNMYNSISTLIANMLPEGIPTVLR